MQRGRKRNREGEEGFGFVERKSELRMGSGEMGVAESDDASL